MVKGTAYVAGPDTNTVLNKQMKCDSSYRSCLVIGQSQSLTAYMIWFDSLSVCTSNHQTSPTPKE